MLEVQSDQCHCQEVSDHMGRRLTAQYVTSTDSDLYTQHDCTDSDLHTQTLQTVTFSGSEHEE